MEKFKCYEVAKLTQLHFEARQTPRPCLKGRQGALIAFCAAPSLDGLAHQYMYRLGTMSNNTFTLLTASNRLELALAAVSTTAEGNNTCASPILPRSCSVALFSSTWPD